MQDVVGVTCGQVLPVGGEDPVGVAVARGTEPGSVVLRSTHDVVREFIVNRDVVELLGCDPVLLRPVLAAVPGLAHSTVVAVEDVI